MVFRFQTYDVDNVRPVSLACISASASAVAVYSPSLILALWYTVYSHAVPYAGHVNTESKTAENMMKEDADF